MKSINVLFGSSLSQTQPCRGLDTTTVGGNHEGYYKGCFKRTGTVFRNGMRMSFVMRSKPSTSPLHDMSGFLNIRRMFTNGLK